MAKFEAESYTQFRIAYPNRLFDVLKPYCRVSVDHPLQVLDLGAGTGLSSHSFSNFFPHSQFTLVEPDVEMLDSAKKNQASLVHPSQSISASAETFACEVQMDGVLIGSAWHWMDSGRTIPQILKALKPGGFVFVFEYQFPKARGENGQALNEWVRREFNLRWRVKDQKPRGTLFELTEPFRSSPEFSEQKRVEIEEIKVCSHQEWAGFLFSQSRYLDYEKRLSGQELTFERERVALAIGPFFGPTDQMSISYAFEGFVFLRRTV